jgi:hypothetical protein
MSITSDATYVRGAISLPPTGRAHEPVFNDDLLATPHDVEFARSQFPEIFHLLNHERLRGMFAQFEVEANTARDRVRMFGLATVLFATLALVAVATQPLWPHTFFARWVAMALELGGMLAALVASGGLWLGPWKRRWLESRMMAERLRQWHFQLLLRRGHEIEGSLDNPDAIAAFEDDRSRWLDEFLQAHLGHLDAKLGALIGELGYTETWLHPKTAYTNGSNVLSHVCRAYDQLRLDRQYGYAVYKLRNGADTPVWRFLKWPAIQQAALLSALSFVGLVSALVCSAVLIYAHSFGLPAGVEEAFQVGAIVSAVIGLALRTVQEGLVPEKEIERYNDYRGRVAQLRDRFRQTTDQRERLQLMEELEVAAVDEMRGFLRTHHRATFVLT